MRLAYYIGKIVVESVRYGVSSRRYSVVVVILLGLALLAVSLSAQAAAPLVLYPFA